MFEGQVWIALKRTDKHYEVLWELWEKLITGVLMQWDKLPGVIMINIVHEGNKNSTKEKSNFLAGVWSIQLATFRVVSCYENVRASTP